MFGGVTFILIQLKSRRGGILRDAGLPLSGRKVPAAACVYPAVVFAMLVSLGRKRSFLQSDDASLPLLFATLPHRDALIFYSDAPFPFLSFLSFHPISFSSLSLLLLVLFPSPKWDFKTYYTFHLTIHHHSQSILCSCLTTLRVSFYFQSPLLSPAPSLSAVAPTSSSSFLVSISSPVLQESPVIKL